MARVTLDFVTGQSQELVALAKGNGLNRADGGAAWCPPLLSNPIITKRTFAYFWKERIMVVVGGDLKGTSHQAVATADTLGDIVVDRAVILLGQGASDTSRDTGRILAVHALDLDKGGYHLIPLVKLTRIVPVYYGVGFSSRPALAFQDAEIIKGLIRRGQAVDLVASQLAFAAANAHGEIHQAAVWVWRGFGRAYGPGAFWTAGQDAPEHASGCHEETASADLHGIPHRMMRSEPAPL